MPPVQPLANIQHTLARTVADRLELRFAMLYGPTAEWSPVFKTPAEIAQDSPLLLDVIEDARILYERDDFLRQALADFEARLRRLGARRIWRGSAWYWDLKPDYKPARFSSCDDVSVSILDHCACYPADPYFNSASRTETQ